MSSTNVTCTTAGSCRICQTECSTQCAHCKKVYYCSPSCQKLDRKSHRVLECFPCKLVKLDSDSSSADSNLCWVTTRDIGENELIFSETPVISGPANRITGNFRMEREPGYDYIPICLGCHKIASRSTTKPRNKHYNICSRCSWPVCNTSCENNPGHAERECPYLIKAGKIPEKVMMEYLIVSILRALLTKTREPAKWAIIKRLKPTGPPIPNADSDANYIQEPFEHGPTLFINVMGLDVTLEEVTLVSLLWTHMGVCLIQSAEYAQLDLLTKVTLVAQSCTLNTKSWPHEYPNGKQLHRVYAATKIPTGVKLTGNAMGGNLFMGTSARRMLLSENFGVWCKCDRCSDPTECGTYLSALVCPGHPKGSPGYLLPINSLDHDSDWACTEVTTCGVKAQSVDYARKILAPIENRVYCLIDAAGEMGFDIMQHRTLTLKEYTLTMAMEKYDEELESFIHPNHYFKFLLRKQIIFGMNFIASAITEGRVPRGIFRRRSTGLQILERMSKITTECSAVIGGVAPGLSMYSGRMLFFFAISRFAFAIENESIGGSRDKTQKAREAGNQAVNTVRSVFLDVEQLGPAEYKSVLTNLQMIQNFASSI